MTKELSGIYQVIFLVKYSKTVTIKTGLTVSYLYYSLKNRNKSFLERVFGSENEQAILKFSLKTVN